MGPSGPCGHRCTQRTWWGAYMGLRQRVTGAGRVTRDWTKWKDWSRPWPYSNDPPRRGAGPDNGSGVTMGMLVGLCLERKIQGVARHEGRGNVQFMTYVILIKS